MIFKTFPHNQEDMNADYIYLTEFSNAKLTYYNKQKTYPKRVKDPCSCKVPTKIINLVRTYGNDGQDDDAFSEELPFMYPNYISKSLQSSPRARLPKTHKFSRFNHLENHYTLHSHPDRFLPRRKSSTTAIESFRANKDPKLMTPNERLSRNQYSNVDAFGFKRDSILSRATSANPSSGRIVSVSRDLSGGSLLALQSNTSVGNGERQASIGTVWRVGGLAHSTVLSNERGGSQLSSSNAPIYTTSFSSKPKTQDDIEKLENRLAEALSLNRTSRILDCQNFNFQGLSKKTRWDQIECHWVSSELPLKKIKTDEVRNLPLTPFKILDAPNLRDDFYCSVLAYSETCHTLAVALGPLLYAWSELRGVQLLNSRSANGSWLTSLGFSSNSGKKCILGFGRSDGSLSLMSLYDNMLPRFEVKQPFPIACLAWRPQFTIRPSKSPVSPGIHVKTEDLLIGDEIGNVYYYSVEWPECREVARDGWLGSMTLLARISVHTQQICGLSFSSDGSLFATGGNDNLCCLFQTDIITHCQKTQSGEETSIADVESEGVKEMNAGSEKHRWIHGAAVKAIAFCPWKEGLLATGGGSNDKCIHFYHANSGSCLATISVSAQVTSLIWSNTRREICATFGYAQPEHPYRIAVFSWPDCRQVYAIPWEGDHRALYAIPYHGGPNEIQTSREGGVGLSRTAQEGCIVVASSDESVKFHEVWAGQKKGTATVKGLLGGSDVIEGLESIDKEGEVIR
ncbi:Meiotic fizzy-related protein 2 [Golovinomyces cichoracearum]|uniref:Meiotic fizzy-related protein 2 n=1 Tax=Golovinomyces cichoracearum TaxID=62708 RepID=A0A420IFI7_9PEZI|nr:Meiotic fizzy-related protein 2 [Golovinomyces cichoracearum]